jgi:hypothetical protein
MHLIIIASILVTVMGRSSDQPEDANLRGVVPMQPIQQNIPAVPGTPQGNGNILDLIDEDEEDEESAVNPVFAR